MSGWWRTSLTVAWSMAAAAAVAAASAALAADEPATDKKAEPAAPTPPAAAAKEVIAEAKPADGKPPKPAFAVLLKDATKLSGLIPLYRKDDKLYAELSDGLLGKEMFVTISIARGIGDRHSSAA